jgi:hypothetical protein
MFKTFITKSSAGHYTVTIKDEQRNVLFKRHLVDNLVYAREIAAEILADLQARAREPQFDSEYGKLSAASYEIADHRLRSEVQDVLCSAADNATETMQEVKDRAWESVFISSLGSILSFYHSGLEESVREWFRANGVTW